MVKSFKVFLLTLLFVSVSTSNVLAAAPASQNTNFFDQINIIKILFDKINDLQNQINHLTKLLEEKNKPTPVPTVIPADPYVTSKDTDITSSFPGGMNYWTRGNATGKNNWDGAVGTYTDSCAGNTLTEYWIYKGLVAQSNFGCPSGCSNGACTGPAKITSCSSEGVCEGEYAKVVETVPALTFTATGADGRVFDKDIISVTMGTTVDFAYSSANTVSCYAYFNNTLMNSTDIGLTQGATTGKFGTMPKLVGSNTYKITCSNSNGRQVSKSITINVISTPQITVLTPNGGEKISPDKQYNITWKSSNANTVIRIRLTAYDDNGNEIGKCMIGDFIKNTGSYSWIPNQKCGNFVPKDKKYKIAVADQTLNDFNLEAQDYSDNFFQIENKNFIIKVAKQETQGDMQSVSLEWDSFPGTVKYNLYTKPLSAVNYSDVPYLSTGENSITYKIRGEGSYNVKVRACQTADICTDSNEITIQP